MATVNFTGAVDRDLLKRAKIIAAKTDTSVNALFNAELRYLVETFESAEASSNQNYRTLIDFSLGRLDDLAAMAALGIDSDVHYPRPDHLQPPWRQPQPPALPATEAAAAEVLSLPCHPALTNEEVARVIDAGNAFR